ncbi:unnamed protein product [Heterobilharzia americana]|nr:unnamed protein product [Heterobilharzia americana]
MTDEDDEFSDDEEDEDEVVVVKEESAVHAWFVLVQITCTALNKCKPWPGKVYLLRAARALSEFALEQRSIIEELADQDVIHQMWCALERETRPRRAEGIGLGYQAEAFLTFASFNEAYENATTESHHESVDHLSELFVLIVPQWLKRGKNSTQNKNSENLRLNTKLNDFELGQAVRAVGIIWPLNVTKEDLPQCKLVQVACLASALAVLAKLNPEQSAQIVESTGNQLLNHSLNRPQRTFGKSQTISRKSEISAPPRTCSGNNRWTFKTSKLYKFMSRINSSTVDFISER